ncbi:MAG: hypothetical protein L0I29_03935 [Hyphomicrobiales bacterium]|nr:hypothetical protein [Hyphomicrobiales bacterium]
MPAASFRLLSLSAPVVAMLVALPAATQNEQMDRLGSQLCLPGTGIEADPAQLASLSLGTGHEDHRGPQNEVGTRRNKGVPRHFDAKTAKYRFELTALDGGPPVAGQEARAILLVADATTGLPITGQDATGWMMLRRNAQVSAEISCSAKIQLLTRGNLTTRPDVDFNASRLLVLDRMGAVSVVDPQVDFTITQMQKIIPLPGAVADWALSADQAHLFVSVPAYGTVAVLDMKTYQVKNLLEFGKGAVPTELRPLADGKLAVWLSAKGEVAIAGPDDSQSPRPVAVGPGQATLVPAGPSRLIVASAAGRLMMLDTATAKSLSETAIAAASPIIAYDSAAARLFLASETAVEIEVLDATTLKRSPSISVPTGISALAMAPDGRHLLATNRRSSELLLIDTASGAVLERVPVAEQPVEIAFTHDYAYVRGLGGDHFTIVELAGIAAGRLLPLNVQSASRPQQAREALAGARLIAPYGHGAMVANPAERVAYYYMEGMNTPMGTVGIYTPQAQGILTLDRGFRETRPGVYEATASLPFGGAYDVPVVFGDQANAQCFDVTVAPGLESETARKKTSVVLDQVSASTGTSPLARRVTFRITDDRSGAVLEGIEDVRVLAFSSSGAWQTRKWAKDMGQGRYAVDWAFPADGRYGIAITSASRDLAAKDSRPIYLKIEANTSNEGDGEGRKQ